MQRAIQETVPLVVAIVLLGTRAGMAPLNDTYLITALPNDVQGSGYGMLRTIYLSLGALGSVIVGVFVDHDLFDEAFLFLTGITALTVGLYIYLRPRPATL